MSECSIPDFYTHSEPVARKRYRCVECSAPILKGEQHFKCTGKWDGDLSTHRQHLLCMEACMLIRDEIEHECIGFGELRDWVGEYHFDLKAYKTKPSVKKLRSLLARIRLRERKHLRDNKS